MDWWLWLILGVVVVGLFGSASEKEKAKKKAEEDVAERKQRAVEAREKIMQSGDKDLINRLLLMEATAERYATSGTTTAHGASPLATAASVAGGVLVADAVASSVHAAQLEEALADF